MLHFYWLSWKKSVFVFQRGKILTKKWVKSKRNVCCFDTRWTIHPHRGSFLVMFSRQVQSVLYIILLQGLTKRLTDSPLSTCGDAVLSWRGRSHEVSPTPASNKGIKADYECSFYFIVAKHTTLLSLYVVFPLLLSHIWPHFLLLYWYRHILICELRAYFLSNKGLLTVERTNLDCFGVFFIFCFCWVWMKYVWWQ